MNTTINTWGNSLGIRIPTVFINSLNLKKGTPITISLGKDNSLQLKPLLTQGKKNLADIVSKINTENKHSLVEWGKSVGKEA